VIQHKNEQERGAAYRGRQISGLLLLGGILLTAALLRANWHDLFPTGWWHVW
jgi:hypothetical protein